MRKSQMGIPIVAGERCFFWCPSTWRFEAVVGSFASGKSTECLKIS